MNRPFTPARLRTLAGTSILLALMLGTGFVCEQPEHKTGAGIWDVWGGNLHHTHFAEAETALGPRTSQLQVRWKMDAPARSRPSLR